MGHRHRAIQRALTVGALVLTTGLSGSGAAAAGPATSEPTVNTSPPFTVYVAQSMPDPDHPDRPLGSDANSGLSRQDPVATLGRVLEILHASPEARDPQRSVEIRFYPGPYHRDISSSSLRWDFIKQKEGTYVAFMPLDYTRRVPYTSGDSWDEVAAEGGRPIFDGNCRTDVWLRVYPPRDAASITRTNLEFYYLKIHHYYMEGILLQGDTEPNEDGVELSASPNVNHNLFYGNYIGQIGNAHCPDAPRPSYAGIGLVNSSFNTIHNNHFVGLENVSGEAGLVHGVYASHHSQSNLIRGNRFLDISGDPTRVRHNSNDNVITDNTFTHTGNHGYVSDWFCRPRRTDCQAEWTSHRNEFTYNTLRGSYTGEVIVPAFCYYPVGPCPSDRIYVTGNTTS